MERYLVALRNIRSMSPTLEGDLQKGVYPIRLNKGEIIQTANDHVDGLFFVEKGLLQLFRMKENKKAIYRFTVEDQFIVAASGVLSIKTIAEGFWIEALEDCILWHFSSQLMEEICKKHVEFNHHYTIILVEDQGRLDKAYDCYRSENNPQNYYLLREHFPYLLDRVPIPNLANFTGLKESTFRHLHSKAALRRL